MAATICTSVKSGKSGPQSSDLSGMVDTSKESQLHEELDRLLEPATTSHTVRAEDANLGILILRIYGMNY